MLGGNKTVSMYDSRQKEVAVWFQAGKELSVCNTGPNYRTPSTAFKTIKMFNQLMILCLPLICISSITLLVHTMTVILTGFLFLSRFAIN